MWWDLQTEDLNITIKDHYLDILQPWAEARSEVMMEGCVGEKWRRRGKEWKRTERVGDCSWVIGFALIRWGICRRHRDEPTAYFYDLQSSFIHPTPPVLHKPGATWVGCSDLYLCARVCHMYMNVHVLEHKTNVLEFLVIDLTLVTDAIHICAQILSWSFWIIFLLTTLNERTWSLSRCKIRQRSFTQDLNSN